ncbi:MAG: hypothetical protein FWE13_02095 [Firmicutes bacterium]|nr:hypothetical protein [Bacillota bacterium]
MKNTKSTHQKSTLRHIVLWLILPVILMIGLGIGSFFLITETTGFQEDLTEVEGVLASYRFIGGDTNRFYIMLEGDSMEYNIWSVLMRGFDRSGFEANVSVGDEVRLIVGPEQRRLYRRTIYFIEANGQVFLTLEESERLYLRNDMWLYIAIGAFGLILAGFFISGLVKFFKKEHLTQVDKEILEFERMGIDKKKNTRQKKAKNETDSDIFFSSDLSADLVAKFEVYEKDVNNRLRDFFTYDEFVEIFSKSDGYPFVFIYRDTCFVMSNSLDLGCEISFTSAHEEDGFDEKEFLKNTKSFSSPKKLFAEVRVEGWEIKDIWNHLERG